MCWNPNCFWAAGEAVGECH